MSKKSKIYLDHTGDGKRIPHEGRFGLKIQTSDVRGMSPFPLLEATLAHITLNRDECPKGSLTLPKTCINGVTTECTHRSSV